MSAVLLWVRCVLRKHVAGTVAIALLGGVAAGVVGVAAQAARRADGALERNLARTRSYDLVVFGCAPGFDPTADDADLQQVDDKCRSLATTRQFRADVVSEIPSIEASTVFGIYVIGIFDPAASNGWGRYILANGAAEADTGGMLASTVVQGRPLDENAPDEVMLGETAAARADIHVGDEITIASWTPDELDFAIDGRVVPSTPAFTSRVVGITRTLDDFQVRDAGSLRQTALPSSLFAGKAWVRAHGADLAGYGCATLGRVVPGVGIDAVVEALHTQAASSDRFVDSESVYEGNNQGALRRVIDTERQAVAVFAAIAALAGLALVGLTASRQLRSEMGGWRSLTALGMSTPRLGGRGSRPNRGGGGAHRPERADGCARRDRARTMDLARPGSARRRPVGIDRDVVANAGRSSVRPCCRRRGRGRGRTLGDARVTRRSAAG